MKNYVYGYKQSSHPIISLNSDLDAGGYQIVQMVMHCFVSIPYDERDK